MTDKLKELIYTRQIPVYISKQDLRNNLLELIYTKTKELNQHRSQYIKSLIYKDLGLIKENNT